MKGPRETDRPLDQIAQAAIYFWGTSDFPDEGWSERDLPKRLEAGEAEEPTDAQLDEWAVGYWSDEDKEAVEEIAATLGPLVTAALHTIGWTGGQ